MLRHRIIDHILEQNQTDTSGSNIGQGGAQKFFPRICRRSKAESGEQSEPILAGVQGPP